MISLSRVSVFLVWVDYSIGNTYVKGAGIEDTFITHTCGRRACIEDGYTGSTYAKGAYTGGFFNKTAYIKSIYAVQHSEM